MPAKVRQEMYVKFIDFIAKDIQKERHKANRRMLNVFFWCFFLPTFVSLAILLLVKLQIVPRAARTHLDWVVLIFPVFYSIYVLSFEVLAQMPSAFRRGGIATTLAQSLKEGEWRDRVTTSMQEAVVATQEEWNWTISSFRMDLQAMQYRTKYLTALAGAVFFLLMQGIDSLTGTEDRVTWVKTMMGWVDASPHDFTQFVGLGLFLVLLYLSGSQTYQSLRRYLNCAELVYQKFLDSSKTS